MDATAAAAGRVRKDLAQPSSSALALSNSQDFGGDTGHASPMFPGQDDNARGNTSSGTDSNETNTAFKSRYLEDFVELGVLGSGSFGTVFKARKKIDGCCYAVKRIRLAHGQAQLREVFALAATNNDTAGNSVLPPLHNTSASPQGCVDGSGFASGSPASMPSSSRSNADTNTRASNVSRHQSATPVSFASFTPGELLLSPRARSPVGISRSMSMSALHVSRDEECPAQILRYFNAWLEEDDDGRDSYLYIQTELCDGTLEDAALSDISSRASRMPDERAVARVLRHILIGLKYLHTRGLVHLDLKPSNIFMRRDNFKIGDLGHITAQTVLADSTAAPRSVSEGDSAYMPVELMQFDSSRLDLTKADIFSLGASIFEVVRGKRLPKKGAEWRGIREGVLVFDRAEAPEVVATTKTPVASPEGRQKGADGIAGDYQDTTMWSSKIDVGAFAESNENSSMLPAIRVSAAFQDLVRSMMHPDPSRRPSAQVLLSNPLLQTETEQRLARAEAENNIMRRAIQNRRDVALGNDLHVFPMRGQSNGGAEESNRVRTMLNRSGRMQRANTM